MKRLALAGALLTTLLLASSASAATRYVDDNHAQCPQATFTSIQAAINASAANDVVRVCAGTYAEALTLPASKPGLYLLSQPSHAAHVVAPAGGLTAFTDPNEFEPRSHLVAVLGAHQQFDDFSVDGPLPQHAPATTCEQPSAIDVEGDGARVATNALSGLSDNCGGDLAIPTFTIGIRISDASAIVEANTIDGAAAGIAFEGSATSATAQNNTITGRGTGLPDPSWGVLVGNASGAFGTGATVRSNHISATGNGIDVTFGSGLVKSNEVHDNDNGVVLDDGAQGLEVSTNFLRDNLGDGFVAAPVAHLGFGRSDVLVSSNNVRGNGHDGLAVYACFHDDPDECDSTTSIRLTSNVAAGNAHLDCYDDVYATFDTWLSNTGVKDSPNICSKR